MKSKPNLNGSNQISARSWRIQLNLGSSDKTQNQPMQPDTQKNLNQ